MKFLSPLPLMLLAIMLLNHPISSFGLEEQQVVPLAQYSPVVAQFITVNLGLQDCKASLEKRITDSMGTTEWECTAVLRDDPTAILVPKDNSTHWEKMGNCDVKVTPKANGFYAAVLPKKFGQKISFDEATQCLEKAFSKIVNLTFWVHTSQVR